MKFLISLMGWPWCYWTLCGLLYFLVFIASLAPVLRLHNQNIKFSRIWLIIDSNLFFLFVLGMMMLSFRWPLFFIPDQLNVDESTFISSTISLQHDPVFWRSTIGGSSGPLGIYPRLLPSLLGISQTFASSRIIALFCVWGTLLAFYRTCLLSASPLIARLFTLAPATFFGLTTHQDFVHFSGEHIPILLLMWAIYFAMRLKIRQGWTSWNAYAAGLLLGAVPFAKLQAVVLALAVTLFCYVFLVVNKESLRVKLFACFWLTLGGLTMPLLLVWQMILTGTYEHFWQSYIVINLIYKNTGLSLINSIINFRVFVFSAPDFLVYIYGITMIGVMNMLVLTYRCGWRKLSGGMLSSLIFTSVIYLLAVYTVMAPGRGFQHYLLFLVFPSANWAFTFQNAVKYNPIGQNNQAKGNLLISSAFLGGAVIYGLLFAYMFSKDSFFRRGQFLEWVSKSRSPVTKEIMLHCSAGEALGLWGWAPKYHVNTATWSATSDWVLQYLTALPPVKDDDVNYLEIIPDFFKNLYIADFKRNNPPVFIDVVAKGSFGFTDHNRYGFESFPPLADHILKNYKLVKEISGIRIFVRNDRLAGYGDAHLHPTAMQ